MQKVNKGQRHQKNKERKKEPKETFPEQTLEFKRKEVMDGQKINF